MDKKATSLIISYVLLITIAIGLSIGIYSWIKSNADISPDIDCKEDTSLIVMGYEIEESPDKLVLSLKNNGYFNIDGFILSVGENELEVPIILLDADDGFEGTAGTYYFPGNPLEPGYTILASFFDTGVDLNTLEIIQVQPFITQKGSKVLCKDCILKLKLSDIPSEVTPPPSEECGNDHLDPGEECDGGANCISAGESGECTCEAGFSPDGIGGCIPDIFNVIITSPYDGQHIPPGTNLNFLAIPTNEIGSVSCVWESNVSGNLEDGLCDFNSTSLIEGRHKITVTATDSGGETAIAEVHVEIGVGTTTNCNNLNWELIPNTQGMNFIDFEVFDEGDGLLYGLTTGGTIFRSNDNGENWESVFNAPNQNVRNLVEFDGKLITYAGEGVLYYSSDGEMWLVGSYPVNPLSPTYDTYIVYGAEILDNNFVYILGSRGRSHPAYWGYTYYSSNGIDGWNFNFKVATVLEKNRLSRLTKFNGELCFSDSRSIAWFKVYCSYGAHFSGNLSWGMSELDLTNSQPIISKTHKLIGPYLYLSDGVNHGGGYWPGPPSYGVRRSATGYGAWSSFYKVSERAIKVIEEFENFVLMGTSDNLQCSPNGDPGTFGAVDGITSSVYAFVEYNGYIYMSTADGLYRAPFSG